MSFHFEIPSEAERHHMAAADALRDTNVELMLRITGGALPDGEAVVLHVFDVELDKPGQFTLDIEDGPEEDFGWDGPTREQPQYLSLKLEKGLMVADLGNALYTLQVERKTDGS